MSKFNLKATLLLSYLMNRAHADTKVLYSFEFCYASSNAFLYGYNMQIFSFYRPMISIYTSNTSMNKTIETIAIVKTLLLIPYHRHFTIMIALMSKSLL